jgi:hypothetical protein
LAKSHPKIFPKSTKNHQKFSLKLAQNWPKIAFKIGSKIGPKSALSHPKI